MTKKQYEPTKEQRAVIEAEGGNLLISASAGSGKTSTVIDRVVALIKRGARIDEMVICTFTRAASADMKEKLYTKLFDGIDGAGGENLRAALDSIASAEISTLHSWCQRILRAHFYAVGLDPAFEVAEEAEAEMLLNESIEAVIGDALEGGDKDFLFFYDALLTHRRHFALSRLMRTVYNYAVTQTDPAAWLSVKATAAYQDPARAVQALKAFERATASRYLEKLNDFEREYIAAGLHRLIKPLESLKDFISDAGASSDVLVSPKGSVDDHAFNERYKTLKEKITKKLTAQRDELCLDSGESSMRYARVIAELVQKLMTVYGEAKARRNKVDYADLEHLTKKLLDDAEVAAEVAARYRYVFIDEYQDINPLQDGIIAALSKQSDVLVVGDIKQSIYAFRGCEPKIFAEKYEHGEKYGFAQTVELNRNFRSVGGVLDFANRVFSRCMSPEFGGVDYRNKAQLTGGANAPGEDAVRVRLIVGETASAEISGVYSVLGHDTTDEEGTKAAAAADAMARDIVDILSRAVVPENGALRPALPSDIAVLSRGVGDAVIAALYERLRELNIPVYVKKELLFASLPETAALIDLIKFLDNPTDDVALAGVLISGLVGLPVAALHQVRTAVKYERADMTIDEPGSFSAAADTYAKTVQDDIAQKLTAFFDECNALREKAREMSAGEVIGGYVAEKGYFGYVYAQKSGASKSAALSAFLQHLNIVGGGASVFEYVESLKNYEPKETGEAPQGAVRIMTAHASKGLEFPFVLLSNTTKAFNKQDRRSTVILDREEGLILKTWDEEKCEVVKNRLYAAAAHRLDARLKEEEMRLLYVALTRPKQSLYIYALLSRPKLESFRAGEFLSPLDADSFFDFIAPAVRMGEVEVLSADEIKIERDTAETKQESEPIDAARVERLVAGVALPPVPVGHITKTSVTAMLADEEAEGAEVPPYVGEVDDRAAVRGTHYHRMMELLDYALPFKDAYAKAAAAGTVTTDISEKEIETAFNNIKAHIGGREFYREQAFMFNDGVQLVQGIIDLLIVDNGTFEIVDYKTSNPAIIKAGKYDKQLRVYQEAAAKILNLTPAGAYIYVFQTGEMIPTKRK